LSSLEKELESCSAKMYSWKLLKTFESSLLEKELALLLPLTVAVVAQAAEVSIAEVSIEHLLQKEAF
jgi:hypothetical protein